MSHKEVMETWFRRVWYEEDLSTIHEMLRNDTHVEGLLEEPQVGPDDFRAFAEAMLGIIGNVDIKIVRMMEDGDWTCALISVNCTNRKTGAPICFNGQVTARIEEGKIVEAYNHLDFVKMYEALGLMPEGTMNLCLSGERISVA